MSWDYQVREVDQGQLGSTLRYLAEERPLGVNLTLPLKQVAFQHVQSVTPEAVAVGAINCLRWNGTGWEGHNTDAAGWWDSFQEGLGVSLSGRSALVLGAGGAARAVLRVLRHQAVGRILVFNRTLDKARELLHEGEEARPWDVHAFHAALEPGCVVIQTTSVGMWPREDQVPLPWPETLPAGVIACDLIYNPAPTLWLQQASTGGAQILDGCGMLVHQAARAIEWWTGQLPDTKSMHEALRRSLT